jgi:SAM-dependent methyltransferase
MVTMSRSVVPEELDELRPEDPRAQRARRDLRRIHHAMRSIAILRGALARLRLARQPRRVIELGSGDGSLILRLARRLRPPWSGVELGLLDREPVVEGHTEEALRRLQWTPVVLRRDALEWAAEGGAQRYDLCIVSLFLHHFDEAALRGLLAGIAARCDALVACEPERGRLAYAFSHLVGALGANSITRGDAVKSVRAGFTGCEIGDAWPSRAADWWTQEFAALPFSHCFVAARTAVRLAAT